MTATRTRAPRHTLPPPPRGRHRSGDSFLQPIVESWSAQPAALKVLRAFLGVTFFYAGVQKLSDGGFFHAGSLSYIGTQLQEFSRGSPIGGLLRFADHVPVLTGLAIALTEIAIGLGTLAGIGPLLFAAGGFLVNLLLTLSATWHVHPYFLGSDSMYAVAWLAYFVGVAETRRRARQAIVSRKGHAVGYAAPGAIGRREMLRGSALAGATLVSASIAATLAGPTTQPASALQRRSGGGSAGDRGQAGGGSASGGAQQASGGTPIASLNSIPVGQAIGFNAPGVGPAALVRLGPDTVVAYSRVCTHAGCLVGYDSSSRILVCPCHGAEFDPAHGAEVIGGPAPAPLTPIKVAVDRQTGQVVIPS
ncbi:MAG TPA: Rieske 2Fe-2S domain-containing protein [Actinomycetota bacterium]|nr:Rieske 2Fe-2S domain-containing protein [Actinomycetota bacterium]